MWTAGSHADAPRPTQPDPPADRHAPQSDEPDGREGMSTPTCDWRLTLEDRAGTRTVRGPGDACCTWVVTVRDLDPVPDPIADKHDELRWSGDDTRVRPGRATTPLRRETQRRETTTAPGHVTATWSRSREPDEVVTTTTARPAAASADDAHELAAAAWSRHLDALRDRGARPDPVGDPDGAADHLEVTRRVAVELRADTTCAGAPDRTDVVGTCEVVLTTDRDAGTTSPTSSRLAAWMEVDGSRVVADRPLGPVSTDVDLAWSRRADHEGLAVTSVPTGEHTIRWRGVVDRSVPTEQVAVVLGHAVRLELPDDDAAGQGHVHAATSTRLRLAVGRHRDDCPCAAVDLVVEVGDAGVVLWVDGDEVPVSPT